MGGAAFLLPRRLQISVGFNAARGFVGGAARNFRGVIRRLMSFNAARGFVGGAATTKSRRQGILSVSMPHAALWVVQRRCTRTYGDALLCFNAARGFVGGAASSLSALFPLGGKSPFGKSPEI